MPSGSRSSGSLTPGVSWRGKRALTPRERDVALLLAQGCQEWQVAIALGVSQRTVKRYVRAIRVKLHVAADVRTWHSRLARVDGGLLGTPRETPARKARPAS